MKTRLLTLLCLFIVGVGTISAEIIEHVKIGDLYYNIDHDNNTAEITYQERNSSTNYSSLTAITVPTKVEYESIAFDVTSIGEDAFEKCTSLTSIIISDGVTSIGHSAFFGCSRLISIRIPNSVTRIGDYAFSGCSCLISTSIPLNVTNIGKYIFHKCSSLTSIEIPNSVTSIGTGAFKECSKLASIELPDGITTIGDDAFAQCTSLYSVNLPSSVSQIRYGAFYGCTSLRLINVALDNITYCSIDGVLFNKDQTILIQCPGGKQGDYTIPNSVIKIEDRAFYNCSGLTAIEIPDGVTSIGGYAFYGCGGLTSVNIPSNVTLLDDSSFAQCTNLISINIPNSITRIGTSAFSGCSNLISIEIPNGVTRIEGGTFSMCSSLTSIDIPNSVTNIGPGAFKECSKLASIELPYSIASIGRTAFWGCCGLMSIEIPNSVINIEDEAFYMLPNVVYSGSATGAPWGARSVNGYVDGNLVYSDATKTTLLACSSLASGEIVIPNSVMHIGDKVFYDCTNLRSINVPNSVTSIGREAFAGCINLISVDIPNSVTSIGDYAFSSVPNINYDGSATGASWGARSINGYVDGNLVYSDATKTTLLACSSLANGEIVIPNSVISIGDMAFSGCAKLTSIVLPNSVMSIGNSAFINCNSLKEVKIPDSVKSIGRYAFFYCDSLPVEDNIRYADTYLVKVVDKTLENYTIKSGTKWIGSYAFSDCRSLTAIEIPNSVVSISSEAFDCCISLTSVEIPNNVTSLGYWAFHKCEWLKSVTIGSSVTYLDGEIFSGCSRLTTITSLNTIPPSCYSTALMDVDKSIPLYVPAESVEAYQTAEVWKDFKDIRALSAEESIVSEIESEPSDNSVIIYWPVSEDAVTYTIEIRKNGELVCSLIFNGQGQLQGIVLGKPSREGGHGGQHTATQVANGWQYTIYGLEANMTYTYNVTARRSDNSVVYSSTKSFTTTNIQTDFDKVAANRNKAHKVLRNGQLFIIMPSGTKYSIIGNKMQ